MSYFVIKGPAMSGQYLCTMPGHASPQWFDRKHARRFPDEEGAWRWLEAIQREHVGAGSYAGRVVRVNTVRDWKAERARLLAEIERLRSRLALDGGGGGG